MQCLCVPPVFVANPLAVQGRGLARLSGPRLSRTIIQDSFKYELSSVADEIKHETVKLTLDNTLTKIERALGSVLRRDTEFPDNRTAVGPGALPPIP